VGRFDRPQASGYPEFITEKELEGAEMRRSVLQLLVACAFGAISIACDSGSGDGGGSGDSASHQDVVGGGEDTRWVPGEDTRRIPGEDTVSPLEDTVVPEDTPFIPGEDTIEPPPDTAEDIPAPEDITPPEPYEFGGPASFVSSYVFGGLEGAPDCCYDLGGDAGLDNIFGEIALAMKSLLGDASFNDLLQEAVENGLPALVLEFNGLDDPVDDPDVTIHGFLCTDSGGTYADNLSGTGSFVVSPSGLNMAGDVPLSELNGEIAGGQLTAEGDGVQVPAFLFPGMYFYVPLVDARIEATVSVGANGEGLASNDGKLGGVVTVPGLVEGLNTFLDEQCTCLNAVEPLFAADGEGKLSFTNANADGTTCDEMVGAEEMCLTLNGFGAAMTVFLKPDLDRDGNDTNDSFSYGVHVDLVSAKVLGLAGEVSACGANSEMTCEDLCGGEGTGSCFCDPTCSDYGDCCPDYEVCCD
jgi:hypothetical protein